VIADGLVSVQRRGRAAPGPPSARRDEVSGRRAGRPRRRRVAPRRTRSGRWRC
jgi:hypothetical protein